MSEKIQHIGKFADRLKLPCHSTDREKAFSDRWILEHERTPLLQLLICSEMRQESCLLPGAMAPVITRSLTQDEATNIATVIQWLGTHVGFDFVRLALLDAGYKLERVTQVKP